MVTQQKRRRNSVIIKIKKTRLKVTHFHCKLENFNCFIKINNKTTKILHTYVNLYCGNQTVDKYAYILRLNTNNAILLCTLFINVTCKNNKCSRGRMYA